MRRFRPTANTSAYVLDEERGQSLWIRQLATGTDIRTVAPEPGQHTGLTFSPDGNYLYYRKKVDNGIFMLYRVGVLGGEPLELMPNVSGIAIAPGGRQLAFFRVDPSKRESASDGCQRRRQRSAPDCNAASASIFFALQPGMVPRWALDRLLCRERGGFYSPGISSHRGSGSRWSGKNHR